MQYPGHILSSHLPSGKEIQQFTDELSQYLFPVTEEPELFILHHKRVLYKLHHVLVGLIASVDPEKKLDKEMITEAFFQSMEEIKNTLLDDAQLILDFDPASTSLEEVILSYPGFNAIMIYRFASLLYRAKVPLIPRIMCEYAHSKTGIDINPGAAIGSPFFIDHGTGVVIGETTIIGNNVKIYQGVTLGALAVRKEDAQIKRHPTIEDNVVIYAGSTILGGNTVIGHDSIIGGNTWLTQSILPYSLVYQKSQTVVNDRKDFEEPVNFII